MIMKQKVTKPNETYVGEIFYLAERKRGREKVIAPALQWEIIPAIRHGVWLVVPRA